MSQSSNDRNSAGDAERNLAQSRPASKKSGSDPNTAGVGSFKRSLVGASVAALLTLGVTLNNAVDRTPAIPDSSNVQRSRAGESQKTEPSRNVFRAGFFDEHVEPEIAKTDALNRQATERCLDRLDRLIASYHRGVDPFVSDLTSLSTRLGIVRRMPGEWWNKDQRVQKYVQEKFEQHLFSERKLLADVTGVLEDFKDDIDVNQKRMLINIQAALDESDLPEVMSQEYPEFFASISEDLQIYAADQGTTSVQNMIGAFVLGEVGAFAVRSMLMGLVSRFGSTAVVATATSATAAAGSSAAGAGGGSLGGPAGTIVGFGVGLAVGLVIDWWMTEKFEKELSQKMHRYLDDLGDALVHGPNRPPSRGRSIGRNGKLGSTPSVGLDTALPKLCDALLIAYRERFYEQIVTGETRP